MSDPNNLDPWAREGVEQYKGNVWGGLGITLLLHALVQMVIGFVVYVLRVSEEIVILAFLPLMYLGLSQLVYMIPAIFFFRRRGDTETAKGLIIGASITFLLNATCNGLLFWNR